MRRRNQRGRAVRYRGPVKIVETTGSWGVYTGERIVLGDGRSLDDDLGLKLRKAFQPGAAEALVRGDALTESFRMREVEIVIRVRRHGP
jgi:hypothetical protein